MTATLRGARLEDHARIIAVVDDWWGGRRMAALLPSLFLEHFAGTSLVAEDDGELAGFLVGFDSPDHPGEAYVHFVGVSPTQRGTGLGRTLHDTFADAARTRGIATVRCVTSTQNTASVAFHTSIGFVVDGTDAPIDVDGVDDVDGHVRMSRRL
jgi:predicted GNAT superfamily acetyltransferase